MRKSTLRGLAVVSALSSAMVLGLSGVADAATGTVEFIRGADGQDLHNPKNGTCVDLRKGHTFGPQGVLNHTDTKVTVYLDETCSTVSDPHAVVAPGKSYRLSDSWYPGILNLGSIKIG
ncbi:hypothetical protein [Streptomyces sp. NPDC093707]|uniref:hypothetical protein n=1 Tax=Streptomyces sp. NPDC093707 TaxID=3154984 RepID=UPI00344CA4D2